ncbi:hypothetical protein JI747_001905 [Chryseobacterium sp. RG1]|uniref:Uncharacterized protein n=1 Tax=Chryseobacterium tagetis TaxID=2801334 RepID=A0ABS7ZXH1_9FLAO|nr:hypothetical protein [Chryseobacterium tagetis]MCA6065913.1 hypothetical protein [Chryseobacterium tagetis]
MKKYTYSFFVLFIFTTTAMAQVAVGGVQSVEGTSTILDFNNTPTNTNGIILSAVSSAPTSFTSSNNGTFLFDRADSKVKMFENNTWVDLTDTGSSTSITVNTSSESSEPQGVIIGSNTSNATGVLVLESSNKALILPRIADPHLNVQKPYPGMICYDTVSKTLAAFDGINWSYWK